MHRSNHAMDTVQLNAIAAKANGTKAILGLVDEGTNLPTTAHNNTISKIIAGPRYLRLRIASAERQRSATREARCTVLLWFGSFFLAGQTARTAKGIELTAAPPDG
jgi:stage III sporulation protein SpoIIIAA